jgi:hypothetical protein
LVGDSADLTLLPQTSTLERYHEATYMLSAYVPPVANSRDIRHPNNAVIEYPVYKEGVEEQKYE